jgi:hypothetical protein
LLNEPRNYHDGQGRHLSPDTVNEFARRNILPAFKKGRQWRFRKRDISSFKRYLRGVNAAA